MRFGFEFTLALAVLILQLCRQIFANQWSCGRDASTWKEPDHFRPERFLHAGGRLVQSYKLIIWTFWMNVVILSLEFEFILLLADLILIIHFSRQIFANQWSCGRDASTWEAPDHFRPERFLDAEGRLVAADHPSRKRSARSVLAKSYLNLSKLATNLV